MHRAALFGVPLQSLCDNNCPPSAVMEMLAHLHANAATDGVMRKSPKQSAVRELRNALDNSKTCLQETLFHISL